eukprot:3218724-Alexandrium_andersonii.AAC.1
MGRLPQSISHYFPFMPGPWTVVPDVRRDASGWIGIACAARTTVLRAFTVALRVQVAAFVDWHPLEPPKPHLATFHTGQDREAVQKRARVCVRACVRAC